MRASRVVALGVLAAVVAAASLAGYRLYDYTEHDPAFCASCHVMHEAWDTWAAGPHASVACKVCHTQDVAARARIVWSWASGGGQELGPHTRLDRRVCASCHLSGESAWKQVGASLGHRRHVQEADLQCLACHLPSLHATEPRAEACQRCHESARTNLGAMGDLHCTTCHDFLSSEEHGRAMLRGRESCLECHQGMQLAGETFPEHGSMAFACADCHRPHSKPFPTFADCLTCHPEVTQDRAHFESRALVDCVQCHHPHDWKAAGWEVHVPPLNRESSSAPTAAGSSDPDRSAPAR